MLQDNGGGIFCNTVEVWKDDGDAVMGAWKDNCDDVLEKGGCLESNSFDAVEEGGCLGG